MKTDNPKPVPNPIIYTKDDDILELTDEIKETPVENLQKNVWEMAGVIKSYRPLGEALLAKILISKELYAFAQGFDSAEAIDEMIKIRDGIYLVLAGNGKIKWFGGKQAKNMQVEDINTYYLGIQNEEEFDELGREMEQIYELKEFEKIIEEGGGAIIDCRKIEGGFMAKVIITKERGGDDPDESFFLVLKNGNRELLRMGGGQAHKITGEEVEIFFSEIITTDHFKIVSDMFETVRGSPKLLPAKGETSKSSDISIQETTSKPVGKPAEQG